MVLNNYIGIGCCLKSGAIYTQEVLKELGLDIGLGVPGKDGVIGWQHLMSTHPMTLRALRKARNSGKMPITWLMQVRNPADTINAMAAMYSRGDWPPIPDMKPVQYRMHMQSDDTNVQKAMRLYYHINQSGMTTKRFSIRYRLEDMARVWHSIAEAVGKPGVELPGFRVRVQNEEGDRTWDEIQSECPDAGVLGCCIERMATKMGYDLYNQKGEPNADNDNEDTAVHTES